MAWSVCCDSLQRIVTQLREKHRAVLMQGTKLKFVTVLMSSWEMLRGTSQQCAAFVSPVPSTLQCADPAPAWGHGDAFWVNWARAGRDAVCSVKPVLDKSWRGDCGAAGDMHGVSCCVSARAPDGHRKKPTRIIDGFGRSQ